MTRQQQIEAAWAEHDRAARSLATGPGSVYTPRKLALQLAEAALTELAIAPALLDPACGCGALLLGAVEWAARERPEWLELWSSGTICGHDIDPRATRVTNRVLTIALGKRRINARALDALDRNNELGQWEAVLCNPPWVSFSGRHAQQLAPDARARLSRDYNAFAGWPSLHAAFAQRCAELTAPDGVLGLLLPAQVGDLAGYALARKAVTEHHSLLHVAELGEQAFDGVTEPALLLVFGQGPGSAEPWTAPRDHGLLQLMSRFQPLPAASFADCGVHTGNAASLLLADEAGRGTRPLRVGRDIVPYKLAPPSLHLRQLTLQSPHYARIADESRFRDCVIVLRQTADRPVAAPHKPWAHFRNSVLACYGAPGHDPNYLLGVLNSDTLASIHRALHRDARQRAFPQVKLSHLRALPVPSRKQAGADYERIANAAAAADTDTVNRLVASVFGLPQ